MVSLKQSLYKGWTNLAQSVMPDLKESVFIDKGQLTPQEFVFAGDNLTHKCPTWHWCEADEKKFDKRFPDQKQFLVTEKVPCLKRVEDLANDANDIKEVDIGDGWTEAVQENQIADEDLQDIDKQQKGTMQVVDGEAVDIDDMEESKDGKEEELADIDDFDPDAEPEATDNIFAGGKFVQGDDGDDDNIKKVRQYDLSITYDFYTRTPRLWLQGYGEDGQLLTKEEMYQDIMGDYSDKTVTMEEHPKINQQQLSIHPCNHAKVMKRIIDTIISNGGEPKVEQSLFVFLKFIASVVPTIQYDFTIDLELD